ncbi:GtrA family protein [Pantoea vagans]|jgi:putative flippase GtrA|uniref:GtrA family protein n=1 Tax=Pantoea vagans TaxID=470934 RepID=UPI00059E4032
MRKLIFEVIKFGIVGVLGFLVDAFLVLQLNTYIGAYGARLISFSCAVMTTWILNRNITFKHSTKSHNVALEFLKYVMSMCIGGSANLICYSLLISSKSHTNENILFATAIGSIVGLFFNFSLSKIFIFKEK